MLIYWSEISTRDDSCISILDELESQSDDIRSLFLSWLNELGSKEINNITIIEHFTSSKGMSLWWMSLLMEKSPFKSFAIIDASKFRRRYNSLKIKSFIFSFLKNVSLIFILSTLNVKYIEYKISLKVRN